MLRKNQEVDLPHEVVYKTSILRLIFVGIIVMIPLIPPGMTLSFSAVALPQMTLNMDESSWFASIYSIACPVGNFISGVTLDKYGRKPALFVSVIPNIFGWFLLINPNASIPILYIGRTLTGFSLGAASLPSVIYGAECITINNHNIRGSVSVWSTVAIGIGTLTTYGAGATLPYYYVAFVGECISVASFILLLLFIPESPTWLYKKGRIGDAEIAQRKLGIKQPLLRNPQIRIIKSFQNEEDSDMTRKSLIDYVYHIRRKEVYKPLMITLVYFFFAQFSGIYCLTSYMVDIISIDSVPVNAYTLTVISGVVQVFAVLILTLILPLAGVKLLACLSAIGIAIGFATLGISESLSLNYIHIASVWLIVLSANLGMSALPYAILGEMFPMGAKGYASLPLIASSIFSFIAVKIYPYCYESYGISVFFTFSFVNICCVIFVKLFLPETVGKTMDEIKDGFVNSAKRKKIRR